MTRFLLFIVVALLVIFISGRPAWFFFRRKMAVKSFTKFLKAYAEQAMRPAPTPQDMFKSMIRAREDYDGDDPEQQAQAFHYRLLRALRNDQKVNKKEIKRLYELGKLKAVNARWISSYPEAVYELRGIGDDIIFFRENLSIVGVKHSDPDVENILVNALERKRLLPDEIEFLRYVASLYEVNEWQKWKGQYAGGPGFPYPDQHYNVRNLVNGNFMNFVFNKDFELIVATQYPGEGKEDEVVWELPGARQPELYQD